MVFNLRKLFCRHRYHDEFLQTHIVGEHIVFTNRCVKCGKSYTVNIPREAIIPKWLDGKEQDE